MNISDLHHPSFTRRLPEYRRYRDALVGGKHFRDTYLEKHSKEEQSDFNYRKSLTPGTCFAKTSILEIAQAISKRLPDVRREGGSTTYNTVASGEKGGVDRKGSSMNVFIQEEVLTELLFLSRVGVLVDSDLSPTLTRADLKDKSPYMYIFRAEDILNWKYTKGRLTSLLLRETREQIDPETDLPTSAKEVYVFYRITDSGVEMTVYDEQRGVLEETTVLSGLVDIPFVLFDIKDSLLSETIDTQIALTNVGSLDINFCIKANYPLYTEQFDPKALNRNVTKAANAFTDTEKGTEANASTAKSQELVMGIGKGRGYSLGTERPGFISPPVDPLRVSMEKGRELRADIKHSLFLSVAGINLSSNTTGTEERTADDGLATIGKILQAGEQRIAELFEYYLNTPEYAAVTYPSDFSLKTDEERMSDGERLLKMVPTTASKTFQRFLHKEAVVTIAGNKVQSKTLESMIQEIQDAKVLSVDPETLRTDVEAGLIDRTTASEARLYPPGVVETAKKEHIERLSAIAISQTKGLGAGAGARGVADLDTEPNSGKEEKEGSSNPDQDPDSKKNQRGKGK